MKRPLLAFVWFYQKAISPYIRSRCRFVPSCSDYMAEAVMAHGGWIGMWLGMKRLCRCHPWGGSGHDPVPAPGESGS